MVKGTMADFLRRDGIEKENVQVKFISGNGRASFRISSRSSPLLREMFRLDLQDELLIAPPRQVHSISTCVAYLCEITSYLGNLGITDASKN